MLVCIILLLLWMATGSAFASGPRFVTGPPFFTGSQGIAVGWKQPTLLFYTDSADLSASVTHAQADAIVEAAAGVWNVPQASITIAQGGQLAEHADSTNVYLDANGIEFPADIQSSNYVTVAIAILYDTDGSVTDTLLGQGASDPSNCEDASVTESVDKFDPAGFIQHAIIVLNGRCTGPAPEQQLELQYKLERVWGRVLGLAWSQSNDNVFTGAPVPTYAQEQHWPILHPIDIVCGPYDYQCLAQPFQLRDDDIASLVAVYPNANAATLGAGKQLSQATAMKSSGRIIFPNGQGMAGVNILVRREPVNSNQPDLWVEGSNISGQMFRRAGVSPFVSAGTDAAGSMGTTDLTQQGAFSLPYIPMLPGHFNQNLVVTTEPVNPLYIGPYSLGPYTPGAVSPAGTGPTPAASGTLYPGNSFSPPMTVTDAPQQCGTGSDGTLTVPMQEPASGWWTGQICGYGHASYIGADVKPARSFTLEVTALDAQGLATTSKLMPVLAFYDPSDTSTQPSLGLSASAFQALGLGTTTLSGQTAQLTRLRLGIADQRGEGRPDFNYQGRLFYADSVLPAQLGPAGGNVTITGTGFRNGNSVQINGVNATVVSWTSTSIVATLPSIAAANATAGVPLDISVADLGTGATSTMSGAFEYAPPALPNVMKLLTAAAGNGFVGQATSVPFAVQMLMPDGVTPIPGENVTFTSAAANLTFGACGNTTCVVVTDANGVASSSTTPTAAGSVTLTASDGALQQTATFTALAQSGSIQVTSNLTTVAVGTAATFSVRVLAPNGAAMKARTVQFSVAAGNVSISGCFASVCSVVTDSNGNASVSLTAAAPGTISLQVSDGGLTVQSSFQATDNSDVMVVIATPSPNAPLGQSQFLAIQLYKHDGVTPDTYQTVFFSASAGSNMANCSTASCPRVTDHTGTTSMQFDPSALGTYTVTVSFGALNQSATFTVVPAPTYQIHIVSLPADGAAVGTPAAQPFTLQVLKADGVTPLTGVRTTLSGTQNIVQLGYCGSGSCSIYTDNHGMASTTVTPLVPGPITLSAVYSPLVQTATFTAVGAPVSLQFTNQPGAAGVTVGNWAPVSIKTIAPGGAPGVGYVQLMATQGSVIISPCAAPCGPKLDLNGLINFSIRAVAPGPITLLANWNTLQQQISFYAYAVGDVLQAVSGPAGTVYTGVAASTPFAVQVFGSDAVTPAPGKAVTLATSIGSVQFAACGGATTCTLTSDANGMVRSVVTPIAQGVTTLTAYDGAANAADTFTAQPPPDLLNLISSPASASWVGSAASTPFSVRVLLPDGITPAAGRSVTVSVTNGSATLGACAGAASCTVAADANGIVSSTVSPTAAGNVVLVADDRGIQVTSSFAALSKPDQMVLVSAPSGNLILGAPATPNIIVRVLDGYGNPYVGRAVLFVAGNGLANWSACPLPNCTVFTDATGTAAVTVAPATAGPITLNISSDNLSQSVAITGVAAPDSIALVSAPSNGALAGGYATIPFTIQVLGGYPIHPQPGRSVTITVANGSALLSACGQSTCTVTTDSAGMASSRVQPLVGGSISLLAQEGGASLNVSFNALALPDILLDISALPPSIQVGSPVTFTVQALEPDGATPDAGRSLQFILTGGTATFPGCAATTCTAITDAQGKAVLAVTPGGVGVLSFVVAETAVSNSEQLPLVLNVAAPVYTVNATQPAIYVAEQTAISFLPSVTIQQAGLSVPSLPVTWNDSTGFTIGSSSSISDASGFASMRATVGPLFAGASASLSACIQQTLCAAFTATGVSASAFRLSVVSGANQAVSAGGSYSNLVAEVSDLASHPIAGAVVTVYQTVSAASQPCPAQGRCPAQDILASRVTVLKSGLDGLISVAPITVAGTPTLTQIAISSGDNGFATAVLSSQ